MPVMPHRFDSWFVCFRHLVMRRKVVLLKAHVEISPIWQAPKVLKAYCMLGDTIPAVTDEKLA